MQIGSITCSYVNRIALSYGEKAEENKNIDSSSPNEEYESFEKSDVKKIEKESYYTNYNDMGRKILAKDFENAINRSKNISNGLSSILLDKGSTNGITNYSKSDTSIEEDDNDLINNESIKSDGTSNGVQDAKEEDKGESETKIVSRNGVRYLEITTTYSDGRTTVETRPLDGHRSKEHGKHDLMSMIW